MPTYEYRCDTCGENFDVTQSFSEDSLSKCPNKSSGLGPAGCIRPGRGRVARVFSAPGISFKGSGFYRNDSRAGTKSNGASKGKDTDKGKTGDKQPAKAESGKSAKADSTASANSSPAKD